MAVDMKVMFAAKIKVYYLSSKKVNSKHRKMCLNPLAGEAYSVFRCAFGVLYLGNGFTHIFVSVNESVIASAKCFCNNTTRGKRE